MAWRVLRLVGGLAMIALFLVYGLIALPSLLPNTRKRRGVEATDNLQALTTAEFAYEAAFSRFLVVGSRGAAEVAVRRGAFQAKGGDWDELGWSPEDDAGCGYWVEVSGQSVDARALCDEDEDGVFAEFRMLDGRGERVTGPDVY